jgi:sec-independent protein translocase protein TatA
MGEFSITHWLIILAILLLFFGPSKLPGLGASLGKAIRGFKAGLNEVDPNQPANNTVHTPTEQITQNQQTTTHTTETVQKTKEPQRG